MNELIATISPTALHALRGQDKNIELIDVLSRASTDRATVSTTDKETRHNPQLQVKDKQVYIDLMNGLSLEDPRRMDIAVPANGGCGLKSAA